MKNILTDTTMLNSVHNTGECNTALIVLQDKEAAAVLALAACSSGDSGSIPTVNFKSLLHKERS
jgi:hypothetical protein